MWILIVIMVFVAGIFILFQYPGSKTMSDFRESVDNRIANTQKQTDVFAEADLVGLPAPVQRFFRSCGYLGTPKMSYMKAAFRNVDFILSEKQTIKIDYTQYNFVEKPERFAYIRSSLYCIPFEGLDSYGNGFGSMKGTLGKVIPLFNQQGESMNKSSLITILAECFIVPNVALQNYISWEGIDDTHAKATISYYGISASGVFTFNENGEAISFQTSDRTSIDMSGSVREAEWSAIYSDYMNNNGIRQPRVLKSIWHYVEGDCVYFNENESEVVIKYY
ncbi:hypothetical protein DFR58_10381 [Anaerobacterium chartisolvens]|uniref:Uncharacterized protein n=2 Tax=Anaerobacterium chartisolvens TaxID=1297424 RepID=A0A369BFK2_9FIRM|nr:hypothetical protein DFR58_10381 [Anaerobacterium chartisolvens]